MVEKRSRKFSDFVAEHARGVTDDEATEALRQLVGQVHTLGKPGKVTLELTVSAHDDVVTITPKVKVTLPPVPVVGKIYYVGDDGLPTKRNPDQPALFDQPDPADVDVDY